MSLETDGGSAEVTDTSSVETSASTDVSTSSSSGYSVTDPGMELHDNGDDGIDVLAALRAENGLTPEGKTEKPSETLDDASDTDDGEAEETETTPAADDAADIEISDELLDRAMDLGYTLEDIKGFDSAKTLEKDIQRAERITERMQQRAATKTDPAKPDPEAKPEPDWKAMIDAGHDPEIIALKKEDWNEIQAQKAVINQLMQRERNREMEAVSERFDNALNSLGEAYEPLFGKGRRGELVGSSPQAVANRDAVFQQMEILRAGYQAAGVKVPSEPDLIQKAVQASFHKQTQEIARNTVKSQIKRAGSQALSRPRSAGAKPLSGAPLALSMEADFWNKNT